MEHCMFKTEEPEQQRIIYVISDLIKMNFARPLSFYCTGLPNQLDWLIKRSTLL